MRKKLQFSSGVLRDMRRPSAPVQGPLARRREMGKNEEMGEDQGPSRSSFPKWSLPAWLDLAPVRIDLWTVGGGAVLGAIAWLFGAGRFGLGLLLGGFLCLLSLYSLKAITSDIVRSGSRSIWTRQVPRLLRLLVMALILFLLLKVSLSCLLGAVASYVWFLGVLAWFGLHPDRSEAPEPAAAPTVPESSETESGPD